MHSVGGDISLLLKWVISKAARKCVPICFRYCVCLWTFIASCPSLATIFSSIIKFFPMSKIRVLSRYRRGTHANSSNCFRMSTIRNPQLILSRIDVWGGELCARFRQYSSINTNWIDLSDCCSVYFTLPCWMCCASDALMWFHYQHPPNNTDDF